MRTKKSRVFSNKISASVLSDMKASGRKITMLTAYDFPTGKILDDSGIDIVLVGDSLGNVILGHENTLPTTMDDMTSHASAVRRAVRNAMLVVDMPFMSYQLSLRDSLFNAARLIKETGAQGVKIEGDIYFDRMKAMIDAGIPVMGHLGFTPQLINQIGGYKVQGRSSSGAKAILSSAKKLEKLGIFALVLEMVPAALARRVSRALDVPVIGIGAGPFCDGQVLVTHDMVGLYPRPVPSFVKQYCDLGKLFKEAVSTFIWEVHCGKFPDKERSY